VAEWHRRQGNLQQAQSLFQKVLDGRRRVLGAASAYTQALLGATLAAQGKYDEAGSLLRAGYGGMVQQQNSIPYEDRGLIEKVNGWLSQFQ
jgi:hypothetical protein